MRAAHPVHPPTDARPTLRVALVDDGVIVFEKLFEGGHVHVGTEPGCEIVIEHGPSKHRLFEKNGGGYRLAPWAGMSSRLSTDSRDLDMNARGSLAIGSSSRLLFHVLPSAPARVPAPLPATLERSVLEQIDWFTTVVAAFSFLLHFFAVALVYSDWADPVVDDHAVISGLVETSKRVHTPPPLFTPQTAAAAASAPRSATTSAADAADKGRADKRQATGQPGVFQNRPSGQSDNDRAANLGAELDALGFQTLSALGADGRAIGVVLDDGRVPIADLDAAGRSRRGAEEATDLKLTDGSQSDGFDAGEGGDGNGPTRTRRSGPDAESAGETKKTRGPVIQGGATGSGVTTGNIPGASGVIARMRGAFRSCYRAGLDSNPTLQGSTSLVAIVAANGSVTSVSGGGGALAPIAGCLKGVVRGAQFSAPKNGRGVVSISINFLLAK